MKRMLPLTPALLHVSSSQQKTFRDQIVRSLNHRLGTCQRSMFLRFPLGVCWCLLHLLVSVVHLWSYLVQVLLSYIISSGLLKKYRNLQLHKLRYLAVVVDSEQAKSKKKIRQLLSWLAAIGVKNVIMYDMEGVLKKSVETDPRSLTSSGITSRSDADVRAATSLLCPESMTIELLSSFDGKEGAARAASFLCSKYLKGDTLVSDRIESVFTETDMADALKAVGCGGPEPDLLLVYGPARCHLGFPAWRVRYTEIVHMGSLNSMKYGAVVKVIYDFSKKHQNYGS